MHWPSVPVLRKSGSCCDARGSPRDIVIWKTNGWVTDTRSGAVPKDDSLVTYFMEFLCGCCGGVAILVDRVVHDPKNELPEARQVRSDAEEASSVPAEQIRQCPATSQADSRVGRVQVRHQVPQDVLVGCFHLGTRRVEKSLTEAPAEPMELLREHLRSRGRCGRRRWRLRPGLRIWGHAYSETVSLRDLHPDQTPLHAPLPTYPKTRTCSPKNINNIIDIVLFLFQVVCTLWKYSYIWLLYPREHSPTALTLPWLSSRRSACWPEPWACIWDEACWGRGTRCRAPATGREPRGCRWSASWTQPTAVPASPRRRTRTPASDPSSPHRAPRLRTNN